MIFVNLDKMYHQLLNKGEWFNGDEVKMARGFGYARNNLEEIRQNNPNLKIYTGFAVGTDTLWRFHTWGILNGVVFEVSRERYEHYYGIEDPVDDFFGDTERSTTPLKLVNPMD